MKIKEADLTDWESIDCLDITKKQLATKCGAAVERKTFYRVATRIQCRKNVRSDAAGDLTLLCNKCGLAAPASVPRCNWSSFCSNEWRAAAEDKSLVTRPFFSNEF